MLSFIPIYRLTKNSIENDHEYLHYKLETKMNLLYITDESKFEITTKKMIEGPNKKFHIPPNMTRDIPLYEAIQREFFEETISLNIVLILLFCLCLIITVLSYSLAPNKISIFLDFKNINTKDKWIVFGFLILINIIFVLCIVFIMLTQEVNFRSYYGILINQEVMKYLNLYEFRLVYSCIIFDTILLISMIVITFIEKYFSHRNLDKSVRYKVDLDSMNAIEMDEFTQDKIDDLI